MERLKFELRTIYLFTKSDLPTSTAINVTFAMAGIASGSNLGLNANIDPSRLPWATVVALYFTWHLTLCFNLGNQRQKLSIIEDSVNKPWRPIPAGRLTPQKALIWQQFAILSLLSLCATTLGAFRVTAFYIFCTWLYNEQSWGDQSWWKRALLNACGITSNRVATLIVTVTATQTPGEFDFTALALCWFFICALVVFTTIQVQDLRDQQGDGKIHRKTVPLIIGDPETRWVTAAAVLFWSIFCAYYWQLSLMASFVPFFAGIVVSSWMLINRTRDADQWAFRLMGAWWIVLYLLPAL